LGDLLLVTAGLGRRFLLGIVCFLLAHIAYSTAFYLRAFHLPAFAAFGIIVAAISVVVYVWLRSHLAGPFRLAAPAYIVVIAMMVALSGSAGVGARDPLIAMGATMFFVSDLFVARDRFVDSHFHNRALGLPLYFCAQIMIALTVTGTTGPHP
jgi:uncharacterized membrane protein YhhN